MISPPRKEFQEVGGGEIERFRAPVVERQEPFQPEGEGDVPQEGQPVIAGLDVIPRRLLVLDDEAVRGEILAVGLELGERRMAGLAGHPVLPGERRHRGRLPRRGRQDDRRSQRGPDDSPHLGLLLPPSLC